MKEREQERIAELELRLIAERRERRSSVLGTLTGLSAVGASIPVALFSDAPLGAKITLAAAGLVATILGGKEIKTVQEKIGDTKSEISKHQELILLSRLRS